MNTPFTKPRGIGRIQHCIQNCLLDKILNYSEIFKWQLFSAVITLSYQKKDQKFVICTDVFAMAANLLSAILQGSSSSGRSGHEPQDCRRVFSVWPVLHLHDPCVEWSQITCWQASWFFFHNTQHKLSLYLNCVITSPFPNPSNLCPFYPTRK